MFSPSTFTERRDAFKASVVGVFPVGGLTFVSLGIGRAPARITLFSALVVILFASATSLESFLSTARRCCFNILTSAGVLGLASSSLINFKFSVSLLICSCSCLSLVTLVCVACNAAAFNASVFCNSSCTAASFNVAAVLAFSNAFNFILVSFAKAS